MTPDEVFSRLRDVHSPQVPASIGLGFDMRPLLAFAVIVLLVAGLHHWRKWRRARARLGRASAASAVSERRDLIVTALQSGPRQIGTTPIPPAFFAPPARLTAEDVAELHHWARRRLR